MKAYVGTFEKKDGSKRTMKFVLLKDLPQEFLSTKLKGKSSHTLNEGMELVWDIEEKNFRIFNRNKVVDNIEEFEYTLP